jgi:phage terminase Nu1 subunit (DNA packaging protein)
LSGRRRRRVLPAAMRKKHERSKRGGRRAGAGPKSSPTSLHSWRTRKEAALAEIREIELGRLRGRSLDAEATARRWETVGREVQARMLAVTSRVRAQLPHLTTADAE